MYMSIMSAPGAPVFTLDDAVFSAPGQVPSHASVGKSRGSSCPPVPQSPKASFPLDGTPLPSQLRTFCPVARLSTPLLRFPPTFLSRAAAVELGSLVLGPNRVTSRAPSTCTRVLVFQWRRTGELAPDVWRLERPLPPMRFQTSRGGSRVAGAGPRVPGNLYID